MAISTYTGLITLSVNIAEVRGSELLPRPLSVEEVSAFGLPRSFTIQTAELEYIECLQKIQLEMERIKCLYAKT